MMTVMIDDDDDISELQPKASLTFEFINTSASTFNPTGSLSSTEDNTHKNKRSKLQKVKVKTNWSSTIKIAILGILLKMQSPRLLAKCPSHLTKCKYA